MTGLNDKLAHAYSIGQVGGKSYEQQATSTDGKSSKQ